MFNYGKRTYIMGILNVTPDSFSDGGNFFDVNSALEQAEQMVEAGADIIDIGGESTRPGANKVTATEELARITPVLKKLVANLKVPISVDTYKADVAKEVLNLGADIINDVRGLQGDSNLAKVVADYNVPVVIMHNARLYDKEGDIIDCVKAFLTESIKIAKEAGIKDENIILDPGIGFGISSKESMEIMNRLAELKELGYPILLGTSRKSMIGDILDLPAKERVNGTVATTVMGIMQGVDLVRVHDVKENLEAAKVTDAIYR
ncbi:dihydropteroate synthase [Halobacteroides halobius DSM 5150]|uniref:Dihydropteroate synthase n=1 Tax=Halobacteroides halobius (strain ATCC 35273 / DSM 5150 / MD-1) TaxID=748449 RepID=L0K5C1_HALHC|nr:dihydropteroate synthase [Halobacteroides halobius]AGB40472.1 dihydropteroate synthase [Halobacteroides halobius DSM 5150]